MLWSTIPIILRCCMTLGDNETTACNVLLCVSTTRIHGLSSHICIMIREPSSTEMSLIPTLDKFWLFWRRTNICWMCHLVVHIMMLLRLWSITQMCEIELHIQTNLWHRQRPKAIRYGHVLRRAEDQHFWDIVELLISKQKGSKKELTELFGFGYLRTYFNLIITRSTSQPARRGNLV